MHKCFMLTMHNFHLIKDVAQNCGGTIKEVICTVVLKLKQVNNLVMLDIKGDVFFHYSMKPIVT